ncbi:MAG: T9SS type A sorting domain-containing protein [Tunicatimonas sp.]
MHVSQYMWDDDDAYETIEINPSGRHGIEVEGTRTYYTDNNGEVFQEGGYYDGYFIDIVQSENGAVFIYRDRESNEIVTIDLPGNTPEHDYMLANQQSSPGRVDTVYQLVTERIFTSDTVYLQETITLEGDVDTVFVNRTFTTRDTVYNQTTITQVNIDSVFLVGGQYAKDVVLALDKALNSETLQAYPNPASDAVTISSEASGNVELKIYDTLGKVMESVPLSGGPHDTVINVADYGSGVYLYMLVGENGRSSTKRFIVD